MTTPSRPPVPPFHEASARQKVLAAEAVWNTRDPERVASSINDIAIADGERRIFGPRPDGDTTGLPLR